MNDQDLKAMNSASASSHLLQIASGGDAFPQRADFLNLIEMNKLWAIYN